MKKPYAEQLAIKDLKRRESLNVNLEDGLVVIEFPVGVWFEIISCLTWNPRHPPEDSECRQRIAAALAAKCADALDRGRSTLKTKLAAEEVFGGKR